MHRVSLHYTLGIVAAPALVRNPLLDLLQAVSEQGSISAAARAMNMSYRRAWLLVERPVADYLLDWLRLQKLLHVSLWEPRFKISAMQASCLHQEMVLLEEFL